MSDAPTVVEAWSAVMGAVQGIGKGDRNKQQGFSFRGIDRVMNAVGPALREHGVIVTPYPEDITTDTYQTDRGTTMHSAVVKMRYTVHGPAGDSFEGGAYGEAADAGDKAVSKAQSVAYRVFLLQGLTIPTDEPDPDTESHQRAATPPSPESLTKLRELAGQLTDGQRIELKAWRVENRMPELPQMSDAEREAAIRYIDEKGWLS